MFLSWKCSENYNFCRKKWKILDLFGEKLEIWSFLVKNHNGGPLIFEKIWGKKREPLGKIFYFFVMEGLAPRKYFFEHKIFFFWAQNYFFAHKYSFLSTKYFLRTSILFWAQSIFCAQVIFIHVYYKCVKIF